MTSEAKTRPAGKMRRTHFIATNERCAVCGREFLKRRSWAQFCGDRCRKNFHKNLCHAGLDISLRETMRRCESMLGEIINLLRGEIRP
jgi:hypothetical protein